MMEKIDRLFATLQALREAQQPVTAASLADQMQVAPRTVYRDIQALRGLGAVIDGAAGFGYFLIEDARLPPLSFDDSELDALALGLREVGEIGDPALARAAQSAVAKLRGRLPARQAERLHHPVLTAKRFSKPRPPAIDAAVLRAACQQECEITFSYCDSHGVQSRRQVRPLGIAFLDQTHCLIAHCHLRSAFRNFRLDRMSGLQTGGPSFRPHRVALLREALASLEQDGFVFGSAPPRR